MTKEQVLAVYAQLGKEERIRLLVRLSHKLTVIARDAYFQGKVQNPAKLIRTNELQHRLVGLTIDLIDGQAVRTDQEIAEYLLTGFAEIDATAMLEQTLKG